MTRSRPVEPFMRIIVTGGSGKAGRWVVRGLRELGHDVLSVDVVRDAGGGPSLIADLTDLGQCYDVLGGVDAVVHLAAIPAWGIRPEGETFRNNTMSTFNLFSAAVALGLKRVVYASSETVLGVPFGLLAPAFAPIDDTIDPRPESSYALSKLLGEEMAHQFARRSGIGFVGLRLSNIMEPADYEAFPGYWDDARLRSFNLWSYVDVRDVTGAVRRALFAAPIGSEVCTIAAADTVMIRRSRDLLAEVYPEITPRREIAGFESLLSIDRARRVLGYEPEHSWRDHVAAPAGGGAAAKKGRRRGAEQS